MFYKKVEIQNDNFLITSIYDLFSRNRNFNHLETILNNEHVERIEIAMKETADSKGWSEILTLNFVVEDIFVDFGVYCK